MKSLQFDCMQEERKAERWKQKLRKTFQVYIAILALFLGAYVSMVDVDPRPAPLVHINLNTADTLKQLVKTKFFRIIRVNIENDCPFWAQQKMCKSGSCNVCRCDQKDIPQQWVKTDLITRDSKGIDQWAAERSSEQHNNQNGIWHVEDVQNDKGQYFDVDLNKQAYTAYNGSFIWSLIYGENCFSGKLQTMCREEKFFYKVISGLHTSISTHLSMFYKDLKPFTNPQDVPYYLNEEEYLKRVGNWPQRVQNLYFLYGALLTSVAKIKEELLNYKIVSDKVTQDLQATVLLQNFIKELDQFRPPEGLTAFANTSHPYIKDYRRYIHNISRIMDCVQCQKCRLFGKMQTYGLGTALKVILGSTHLKRNQMVALLNTLNKISMSISTNLELVKSKKDAMFVYLMIYTWVGLCLFSFLLSALKIYKTLGGRVKKMFKHTFPKNIKQE